MVIEYAYRWISIEMEKPARIVGTQVDRVRRNFRDLCAEALVKG